MGDRSTPNISSIPKEQLKHYRKENKILKNEIRSIDGNKSNNGVIYRSNESSENNVLDDSGGNSVGDVSVAAHSGGALSVSVRLDLIR